MCKLPFKISETKKKLGIYCCAYGCKNDAIYRKGGLCSKHYHRKTKAIDPVYDRFCNFKRNALRRGKDFQISLDEFRSWCKDTGYIITKGKRGQNATIDRVKNYLGYTIDNIQLLTNKQNIKKYHELDKHQLEEIGLPF